MLPLAMVLAAVTASPAPPLEAAAAVCGQSSSHTICLMMPVDPDPGGVYHLSSNVAIGVTNSPNSGTLFFSWHLDGGSTIRLMESDTPSAQDGGKDYDFTWPTAKYLDGTGTLRVQYGSTSSAAVSIAVALENGNVSSIEQNPTDWTTPAPWTDPSADPVVPAVGDGASDEAPSKAVSDQLAAAHPPLFLYLGDIYETSTYTELVNHYGVSDQEVPGGGTLYGQTASVTQPTVGNHEITNIPAWQDYFHGRPRYMAFRFGGVQFLDLDSNLSMKAGSAQYGWVQSVLGTPDLPACVVAYFHHPALWGTNVVNGRKAMWALLANGGGDLVLNGHHHTMAVYGPLDASLTQGTGSHMYEIVSGAGGYSLGKAAPGDGRLVFTKGKTPGAVWLTLNGAHADAGGVPGVATSVTWQFETTDGAPISGSDGTVAC